MPQNPETLAIEDILKLQSEAFKEHREGMKEIMALLETEIKEFRTSRELQEDMVKEYDRLTQRISTQLRAMIELTTRLEGLR